MGPRHRAEGHLRGGLDVGPRRVFPELDSTSEQCGHWAVPTVEQLLGLTFGQSPNCNQAIIPQLPPFPWLPSHLRPDSPGSQPYTGLSASLAASRSISSRCPAHQRHLEPTTPPCVLGLWCFLFPLPPVLSVEDTCVHSSLFSSQLESPFLRELPLTAS